MPHTLEHPLTALDVIFTRRSVRAFAPTPIDTTTVQALLDAAVQAATAVHAEPWAFVVVQDPKVLTRLSDRAKGRWAEEAPQYRGLHPAGDPTLSRAFLERMASPDFSLFYDAGTLIAICATTHGAFAHADCWLAAGNLMTAATALGLGTCVIGSAIPTLNSPETKAELHIAAEVDVVAPIIVGVPRGTPPESTRKAPRILSWIRPGA